MVPDISSPANLSSPGSSAGHCSRHSVKINFNDIGWSHILAPRQVGDVVPGVDTELDCR